MKIVVANSKGGSGKSTLVLALADVISDVQIVDMDLQGTISISSKFTNRHVPVKASEVSTKCVLYDTPPYHSDEFKSIFESADLVMIPVKIGYPDLLATKGVIDDLRSLKMIDKGIIVFNEVRKPYNKTYHEVKSLFFDNYKDIKKAKSELSSLVGFRRILSDPLSGQAKRETALLVKELGITF